MWKNGYKSSSRLYNYYDIHPMAKKCFQVLAALNLVKNWWNAEWKKENQKLLLHAYIILQHNFTVEFTLSEF